MTAIPEKMKGILLTGHGGPEKLVFSDEIPVPRPNPGEVLVKVSAAGVNNTDINTRIGWYSKNDNDPDDAGWSGNALKLPLVQGADVCGYIVSVGENISQNRIGERVLIEPCLREVNGEVLKETFWYLGSECNGGFAEYVTVSARHAYAVDSDYSDEELASFPCSYSTAENLLTRANVSNEDRVFITGASGGVGSAAVQLAKARGAEVVAVTSPSKADKILALGADRVLFRDDNYLEELGENSVHVVIDLVAGEKWSGLLDLLKPSGRYAVSGAIAGPLVELDVRTLYLKDLSFFGCTILEPEVFQNLVSLIEQEKIKPLVAESFPLEKIGLAQQLFETKTHIGKIVLKVSY